MYPSTNSHVLRIVGKLPNLNKSRQSTLLTMIKTRRHERPCVCYQTPGFQRTSMLQKTEDITSSDCIQPVNYSKILDHKNNNRFLLR